MRRTCFLLTFLALVGPVSAADPESVRDDEQTLKAAKLNVDGPSLLDFLRKRTLTDASREKVEALVRQLGDDEFANREKASGELVALGPVAVPLLRRATMDDDLEVRRRAVACLRLIEEQSGSSSLLAATARLLAVRRPPGTAEAILAYLPQADDEALAEQFRSALAAIAVRDGKPEPAVVAALTDKAPARRAAAGVVLAKVADQRDAVGKLLKDDDASVRLYIALTLVEAREKAAIPVLIALLAELPQEQGWRAEEVLFQLAGDKAPNASLGSDEEGRRKCRDAWNAWHKEHGAKLDLAKLSVTQGLLGFTTLTRFDLGTVHGRISEIGPDGKERWLIDGLADPIDVRVLPGNRVLIAEMDSHRVTERNFKGDILWEYKISNPIVAERLADGTTLVATMSEVLIVNREGKALLRHKPENGGSVMGARKLRGGQIAYTTMDGRYVWLDTAGKELKRMNIAKCNTISAFEILPDGTVLVPCSNRVEEYDPAGKLVRAVPVHHVTCVTRLPNGNLLVASLDDRRVVEIDRSGKEVWRHSVQDRAWRARRR